ncbi:MAG: hypothetical protein K0B85_05130 [Coriobacteriia bacterium]|nr:hypothetical protein [Coriobacteriia bacterium]
MHRIKTRVIAMIVLVLMVGGVVALVSIDALYRANVAALAERAVLDAEAQFAAAQAAETEQMVSLLEMVTYDRELRAHMRERDREALFRAVWPRHLLLRDEHAMTHWYFYEEHDDDILVFLRAYRGDEALEPDLHGDVTRSTPVYVARDTGAVSSGFVMGQSRLSLRTAVPWIDEDGTRIGIVSLGQAVTGLLDRISGQTGDGYTMFLDKRLVDREAWAASRSEAGLADDWDEREHTLLVASTFADDSLVEQLDPGEIAEEPSTLGVATREGVIYVEGMFPLRDIEGSPVGSVLVLHDITALHEAMRVGQMVLLLSMLGVALAGSAVVAVLLDRLIFSRLDATVAHIETLSLAVIGGSPLPKDYPGRRADDEIGRFERFLEEFLNVVSVALARRRGDKPPVPGTRVPNGVESRRPGER